MADTQQVQAEQIVKIRLPEAQTQPRELDGNMRSWGRSGERPEAVLAAQETEFEAGS